MPDSLGTLARALIGMGLAIAFVGLALLLLDRVPGLRIGRLPGDFVIQRGGFRLYLPLTTSILLSAVLTLLLWILGRR